MPTGYTEDIYEGKDVSFSDFALKCARAFGACIEQRDDDPNDKPKLIEKTKDNYHIKKIEKAKKWKKPTKAEFDAYVKKQTAYYNEQINKQNKLKASYQKMLDKANAWTPPTKEHEGLKKFMIEQLNSSIEFDCDNDYYQRELNNIKQLTYNQYVKDMRDSNKRDIEYHTNELKKENERVDNRNAWISALYKSLEN
jgi:chromosome condensin MukBEF ATPase and DNA-binding subunit MukB